MKRAGIGGGGQRRAKGQMDRAIGTDRAKILDPAPEAVKIGPKRDGEQRDRSPDRQFRAKRIERRGGKGDLTGGLRKDQEVMTLLKQAGPFLHDGLVVGLGTLAGNGHMGKASHHWTEEGDMKQFPLDDDRKGAKWEHEAGKEKGLEQTHVIRNQHGRC